MKNIYFLLLFLITNNSLKAQTFTGINTQTPQATLDINGNIIIRDIPADNGKNGIITVDANGRLYKIPNEFQPPRIISGTIGSEFNTHTGASKTEQNTAAVEPIGAIYITKGENYTINNPRAGYFIINFNIPFTNIYGASVDIIDTYGADSSSGMKPDLTTPGLRLRTNDNSQIAFLNEKELHIKTGNSLGNLSNRSFTFIVIGKYE